MPTISGLPICSLCNGPVEIETAKIDENGETVHEECYVIKMRPNDHIRISPMTLTCPRCGATAGKVCHIFRSGLELVHVERIEAAGRLGC
jgi:hypothetical protein